MTNQNIIFHDLAKFIMLKTLDDLLLMKLTPLYYNEKNKTYNLYYFYNTIEQLIDECKDFINSPCYCMQLPFRSRVRTVLNNLLNLKKKIHDQDIDSWTIQLKAKISFEKTIKHAKQQLNPKQIPNSLELYQL